MTSKESRKRKFLEEKSKLWDEEVEFEFIKDRMNDRRQAVKRLESLSKDPVVEVLDEVIGLADIVSIVYEYQPYRWCTVHDWSFIGVVCCRCFFYRNYDDGDDDDSYGDPASARCLDSKGLCFITTGTIYVKAPWVKGLVTSSYEDQYVLDQLTKLAEDNDDDDISVDFVKSKPMTIPIGSELSFRSPRDREMDDEYSLTVCLAPTTESSSEDDQSDLSDASDDSELED
jgi:hypothetical protein